MSRPAQAPAVSPDGDLLCPFDSTVLDLHSDGCWHCWRCCGEWWDDDVRKS